MPRKTKQTPKPPAAERKPCPTCGYTFKPGDFMSWCEEHNVMLCPECGMCPTVIPSWKRKARP